MGIRTSPLRGFAAEHQSDSAGGVRLRDRFELLVPLGSGGFGTVWEGFDMLLERPVAVKELPIAGGLDDTDTLREARATARLNHPTIVSLYEIVAEPDRIYMVNELVRGCTLGELIDEGVLSDRDTGKIGYALCEALAHAHAHGVIHRDVKPANVMVTDEWMDGISGWRAQPAKLMDFGIASVIDHGERGHGPHAGTLRYMAPEQAAGEAATPATDAYSLALVLYECFTGADLGRQRRIGLARLRPDLPPGLIDCIDRCLTSEPELRPGIDDLATAVSVALPALSDVLPEPGLWRRLRDHFAFGGIDAVENLSTREARSVSARLANSALAALATAATVSATEMTFTAWPVVAVALVVFLMPRVGWPVVALAGVTALGFAGQPGSAAILAAGTALLASLAAGPLRSFIRGVAAGAFAGAVAFTWTVAVQLIGGRDLVIASAAGIGPVDARRGSLSTGFDAVVASFNPGYLAVFALWAVSGAAIATLIRRHASPPAWFAFGLLAIAAHTLVCQSFGFPVPLAGLAVAPLALVACSLAAASARRIGRVFAVSGDPIPQPPA